jgi:soluble lytic murein transglycosylase-like protein
MKAGLILLLLLKLAAGPAASHPSVNFHPGFPGPEWRKAAKKYGIDSRLLYAVAIRESGRNVGKDRVAPWPYALHFNGSKVAFYAESRREAEQLLKLALPITENVDVGLAQVNWKSHKDKVKRPQDLLDPKTNLEVASQILAEALASTPDKELGVGRYNSWDEKKARKYGREVLILYQAIKEAVKGG